MLSPIENTFSRFASLLSARRFCSRCVALRCALLCVVRSMLSAVAAADASFSPSQLSCSATRGCSRCRSETRGDNRRSEKLDDNRRSERLDDTPTRAHRGPLQSREVSHSTPHVISRAPARDLACNRTCSTSEDRECLHNAQRPKQHRSYREGCSSCARRCAVSGSATRSARARLGAHLSLDSTSALSWSCFITPSIPARTHSLVSSNPTARANHSVPQSQTTPSSEAAH
eukprot:1241316-Rhodomonas_salina.1